MSQFTLKPAARSDLDGIWQYTYETWDVEQADRYIRQLNDGFHRVSDTPTIGRDCSYIREGYRKYQVNRHVIFYRAVSDDTIEIVRVLHEQMDFESHLSDDDS